MIISHLLGCSVRHVSGVAAVERLPLNGLQDRYHLWRTVEDGDCPVYAQLHHLRCHFGLLRCHLVSGPKRSPLTFQLIDICLPVRDSLETRLGPKKPNGFAGL